MAKMPIVLPEVTRLDRVGHVQADALLAHDDRADVELGDVLEDVIDRVADDVLDALLLEDGRDGVSYLHVESLPWLAPVGVLFLVNIEARHRATAKHRWPPGASLSCRSGPLVGCSGVPLSLSTVIGAPVVLEKDFLCVDINRR